MYTCPSAPVCEQRAKVLSGGICNFSKKQRQPMGKRNPCFFWGCLQRSNPCVIFPHREVFPLIANRLCTFAMCGVSRGPAEQPPPPAASSNCGRPPRVQPPRSQVSCGRPPWALRAHPPPRPSPAAPHRRGLRNSPP